MLLMYSGHCIIGKKMKTKGEIQMGIFSLQSMQELSSCDIRLQKIMLEVVEIIDIKILCGHRGKEAQEKAFNEKKSKLHYPESKHNTLPAKAVDIAPYFAVKPNIDWNDLCAFALVAGVVKAVAYRHGVKIRWGADWNQNNRTKDENFMDFPHFEIVD